VTKAAGVANPDNTLVISQLTNAIFIQNKEAMESNNLHCKEIESQIEIEEKNKDQIKKIHPAIISMLLHAAATHKNEKTEAIAPTCLSLHDIPSSIRHRGVRQCDPL
jgi:hypothetical protein